MADLLKDWVRDIFIIVTGLCFAEIVLPMGNMKKYLKFVFSIMILGVVLSPIAYFTDGGHVVDEFSKAYEAFAYGTEVENEGGGTELERIQSLQLDEIYKNKIAAEVTATVESFYPELEIYEVTVINENIVIKGEETEYVSNIIRCVSQRLGIDDRMVTYEVAEENYTDE